MPANSMAQRILPHLRRVALARDADTGDGPLLGEFVTSQDETAFATLVRRHGPMVLGVCQRVIRDPHLAEDAFQATFLVLARRAATVRPRHLVGHWLYGVAYRTALKARGTAARRRLREQQVDPMPQPAISPEDTWTDLQPVLDAELARLPEKLRIPVVLCDLGGRPQREVARELKLPPATLANRLASARRLLAERLSDRGIVLSAGAIVAALSWHATTSAVSPKLAITTAKAVHAIATGQVAGLPAPVVELSDGVMRMFVLKKLKALAVTCLLLLGGIGLLADSTLRANPEEKPIVSAKTETATLAPEPEDAKFLRRLSQELRGTQPSIVELTYFVADKDAKKRQKVTDWMLPEHGRQPANENCTNCHKAAAGNTRAVDFVHGHLKLTPKQASEKSDPDRDRDEFPDVVIGSDESAEYRRVRTLLEAATALRATRRIELKAAEGEEVLRAAQARLAEAEEALKAAEAQIERENIRSRSTLQGLLWLGAQQIEKTEARERRNREVLADYLNIRTTKSKEPTDAEFIRRVSLDIRGTLPSVVETNYFLADKDPKKRENLLALLAKTAKGTPREKFVEELLSDPAVQQRWAEIWKARIAAEKEKAALEELKRLAGDRLSQLLKQLLDEKRPNEQILDALCLATMARFPTDTERKLILDRVKSGEDRRSNWDAVLRALSKTAEAKAHAGTLANRTK